MFHVLSCNEEIAVFVGSALSGEAEGFQRRVLSALTRLREAEWAWLKAYEKTRKWTLCFPTGGSTTKCTLCGRIRGRKNSAQPANVHAFLHIPIIFTAQKADMRCSRLHAPPC